MHQVRRGYSPAFIGYFIVLHLLGGIGVWYAVIHPNPLIVWMAVGYFFLCHLSITVGAHRYFTHQAFQTRKGVALVLATLFSGTVQGSLWWWVAKHMQHHEYEDVPGQDPHTPKDGFFHSHMGWMLKYAAYAALPSRYTRRFANAGVVNEVINWQRHNALKLGVLMAFFVPMLLGLAAGDLWGGLLVIGATRLVVQYHATWIVNSVGHTIGEKGDNLATNFGRMLYLPLTAILTVGEAWHANHHRSSAHWRLGRRWWELDPGAWVISVLAFFGLAWNLKEPADRLRVPQVKSL